MKVFATAVLLALCASPASAVTMGMSPVTRIVELLSGLAKQAEKEGKVEEGLYEDFVCWGKSIISQKTASNSEAASRIDYLETYISDIKAGRIDFTGERAGLEKDIAELMSDLEEAKALRKKEKGEFEDAEDEMTKAIKALTGAAKVLDDATKDHKEGVLLAVRAHLKNAAKEGGMASLLAQQADLKQAAELGEKFLSKADATFLRRVLLGEVPDVDWKKLNRKATFKMSYKARSFKIQDIIAKMKSTFESNLKDARDKEAAAIKDYGTLKGAKEGQLDEARKALTSSDAEMGERGMTLEESQEELDALKKQVSNDNKFIDQTEKALATKKAEWQERSRVRTGEIAAINKAVSILHSDDARDTFKKSFDSQVSLLQTKHRRSRVSISQAAAAALRLAARRSGQTELLSLAQLVGGPALLSPTVFKTILGSIDKMILKLKADEAEDLETKQGCEKDRMEDTRSAIMDSREIDEMTDLITKLTAHIAELKAEIEALTKEKEATKKALDEATEQRKKENEEWKYNDKMDGEAIDLVIKARNVLDGFYKDEGLMLVQKKTQQPVEGMAGGDAPPPPPTTWEAPYGGKTGESTGILAIMDMVKEDIIKDKKDASTEENDALKEFEAFKKESLEKIGDLKKRIIEANGALGDAEGKKGETKKERTSKKTSLVSQIKSIKGIDPNCEYFAVNYVMRRDNRFIELDGLNKAKAILEGGKFDPEDPNREIKPGDAAALLQKSRRA